MIYSGKYIIKVLEIYVELSKGIFLREIPPISYRG